MREQPPRPLTRRHLLQTIGGIGLAGIAGCVTGRVPLCAHSSDESKTGGTGTAWSSFQYDIANTGYNPTGVGPERKVCQQWVFEPDGDRVPGMSAPAIVDGIVYTGCSPNRNFYAIDAATGREQWRFKTERGPSDSSPAVVDGTIYFGSNEGAIYALNAADGSLQWTFEVDSYVPCHCSPTVVGEMVYFYDYDLSILYAVDVTDGTEQWSFSGRSTISGNGVFPSPAVADGSVYIGTSTGLYAIDIHERTERWHFSPPDYAALKHGYSYPADFKSAPAVANGTVYASSTDGYVYAVDTRTGTERWHVDVGTATYSCPAIADETVYFCSENGTDAVASANGTRQWHTDAGDPFTHPTVAGETVYVGSHALNAHTGSIRWQLPSLFTLGSGMPRPSTPIVDGTLYAGTQRGTVLALSEAQSNH